MRETRSTSVSALAQAVIRFYQRWISPAFLPCCRFVPSCSDYALECVRRHGVIRGGVLALWRILRCNPLSRAGVDPVDE